MRKMRKFFTRIAALVLCGSMLTPIAACNMESVNLDNVFKLPHFDGAEMQDSYDTDLLYKNNSNYFGGDSGVIWVSEEQDPEYGGYSP